VIVTLGSDVDQLTRPVMDRVVLSENVPVAAKATEDPPTLVLPGFGVTPIETRVAFVTVKRTAGDVIPANWAVMLLVPAETPVASPSGEIVTTVVAGAANESEAIHDAADDTSWLLPSE
jgi:hypothetical protein